MKLVVDIGGTTIKVGRWQNELKMIDTYPSPDSWDNMLNLFHKINQEHVKDKGYESIHFSVPGIPNHKTGYIDGASSLRFIHENNFVQAMTKIFKTKIYFENDATCASMAEMILGAGKSVDNMIFLIIGTGIGGSVIYNRQIQSGANSFAGEFGMMLVDGKREWAQLGSAVHMARKVSAIKDEIVTGEEVFELAKLGDKECIMATEELYHYLALGIYNLQYIIDPELIILGGGISNNKELIPNIERHLSLIMNNGQRSPLFPKLTTCQFRNDANLIGAAYLKENSYGNI